LQAQAAKEQELPCVSGISMEEIVEEVKGARRYCGH